jgi:hypothetical protein
MHNVAKLLGQTEEGKTAAEDGKQSIDASGDVRSYMYAANFSILGGRQSMVGQAKMPVPPGHRKASGSCPPRGHDYCLI